MARNVASPAVRVRVQELRFVRAGDIDPHPLNWRTHPESQREVLRGAVRDVGFGGALECIEVDGRLILIDGHLRRDEYPDAVLPVLVHDFTAEEALEYLATKDPIAGMAGANVAALAELRARMEDPDSAVSRMLAELGEMAGGVEVIGAEPMKDVARTTNNMQLLGKGARVGLQCGDLMVTISQEHYDRLVAYVEGGEFASRGAAVEGIIDQCCP